jgi:SSS family solute:Na+ symporter
MTTLILFAIYLCALIPLAWLGRRASGGKTPRDFYLAGSKLGFFVLLCTLFATQYSGNTFMAFPGKAYRIGYTYMMSITFMMAMVTFYLLYAPALRRVAVTRGYVTPCDWIHDRYKSRPLTLICALIMMIALLNFLLAQLMAMGHAVEGLTEGRINYRSGVLLLAVVIVLYETIGGMRAVAWTDTLQGLIMAVAVCILGGFLLSRYGELRELPRQILEIAPEKVAPPDWKHCLTWGSTIIIVGLGGAMYPQAIQRIYAARSTLTLQRSLAVMVFLPLGIVLFAYVIGIMAIVQFPGLDAIKSDQVMVMMLGWIAGQGPVLNLAVSLLLLGALAAIMSTADSVLLSLSSIAVQDVYGKTIGHGETDERLLQLGKITSWVLMAIMVSIALTPRTTLFRLLEIKFELLVQVAPAFILGFRRPRLGARTALVGILAGSLIALVGFFHHELSFAGLRISEKWWGVHPGTVGLAVNLILCLAGERFFGGGRSEPWRAEP